MRMTSISEDDKKFIDDNPLNLDSLKSSFTSDQNASHLDSLNLRDAISNLLLTLTAHPVAKRLRSLQRPVNGELAFIYAQVQSDDFDLSPFTPLTTQLNGASDLNIWQVVLQLITDLSRRTPSIKSIPTSYSGTPHVRTSASFQQSNESRSDLYEPVLNELSRRTFVDVPEFFKKYFEDKWSKQLEEIYNNAPSGGLLHDFPSGQPEEADIWTWLDAFQKRYLDNAPAVYYRTKSKKDVTGAQGERQLDILLKHRIVSSAEPHNVKDYLLIGELTKSDKSARWKNKFAQLATYIRDIYAAQPTRRFIHAFLFFGIKMQLWVFDRSGAYSSETFDIQKEPNRFISVIVGYSWMTDEQLGLDTFIQHGSYPSIVLQDTVTGQGRSLQLERLPFVRQPAIVCRGTTCYRTTDKELVVKISWRADKPRSEADYLTMSQGVKGIPILVGCCDLITIDNLRQGLTIRKLKDLGHTVHEKSTNSSSQSAQDFKLSVSGMKRGSSYSDDNALKKQRSRSNLRREIRPHHVSKPETPIPTTDPSYRNRVLTCMAISPAGRPLQEFGSVLEVLEAFRDTIKAHKSLFLDHKILHRDVSLNNIILTNPKQTNGYSGMLIDFDLAVTVDEDYQNETSREKNMTGTLEYMAIQILEGTLTKETAGIDHTYRHDLESFFYVFLTLCIRYGWKSMAPKDPLRAWYTGSFEDICRMKRGDIGRGGFDMFILNKFSPTFECLKGLARELRDILFGTGDLFVGTPKRPRTLYDPMIEAFEEAIQSFKW
jgi:Fungal protein kinase